MVTNSTRDFSFAPLREFLEVKLRRFFNEENSIVFWHLRFAGCPGYRADGGGT
jgi:hypothetical protein